MIDAYELLKQGKSIDEINEIIAAELNAANTKIAEEEEAAAIAAREAAEAAAAKAKREEAINSARKAAVAALTEYFALVNPAVTENIISSVLSTLESVKIKNTKNGTAVWGGGFSNWTDVIDFLVR